MGIRYTLDGSDPTEESTLYSGQFEVTPPVTIKARGYKEGMFASDVASYEVEAPPVPVTVPMALPDGSVLFYDRGTSYGEYKINDSGYPERIDDAIDDGNRWRIDSMVYSVGDTVTIGDIECVIAYDAGSEQSWGRYILCEKHDLNYYEPDLGTGGVEEVYSGKQWGDSGVADDAIDGSIGEGKNNTDILIEKYSSNTYLWYYVNQHRIKTGKQWHVPSLSELRILYENKDVIGNFTINLSEYRFYWSSNQFFSPFQGYLAWYIGFSIGNENAENKNYTGNRVRCVLYATEADLDEWTAIKTPIEITCETEGADIRYTLDGSDPTEESTLYNGQFEVTPPVTIKARGYKEGMLASDVASYEVEIPVVPVTVPMALPDGSVLFYDRGTSYGEYKINDSGYPERIDGAVDDGSAESQNWRYLICDQDDLGNSFNEWGPRNTSEGLTGTSVGYGLPNTKAMVAKYPNNNDYWWKLIKEKRDSTSLDWFMPSKDELNILYDNMSVIPSLGGVALNDLTYWSSSEDGSGGAWWQYFSNGNQSGATKLASGLCRLLRRI